MPNVYSGSLLARAPPEGLRYLSASLGRYRRRGERGDTLIMCSTCEAFVDDVRLMKLLETMMRAEADAGMALHPFHGVRYPFSAGKAKIDTLVTFRSFSRRARTSRM